MAQGALKKLPRETARSFIDGLEDRELADLLTAASAADVASGGSGNLLFESAAARLRGVDVETHGSAVGPAPMWRMLTSEELLKEQGLVARPTVSERGRFIRMQYESPPCAHFAPSKSLQPKKKSKAGAR